MSINRRDFLKISGAVLGCALASQVQSARAEVDPGQQLGMLYDATICVGCNACTNACRQWNDTAPETDARLVYDAPQELSADTWTLIQLYKEGDEYSFVKRQCMHCLHPACVSGCPVHALQKTADGPVTYDKDRCIGCRYCMYTCPFHVPRFEWETAHFPLIAKCHFCYESRYQKGIGGPACADRCPTGALIWGKRADLLAEAESRLAASPDRYVNHIYGKDDAGGTSVIYLSHVPFEKLGLQDLGTRPVPEISEGTANLVLPGVLVGGPLLLGMIRFIANRGGWEDSWPI
jgi:Fe-S-cluster-containing dehydrogenase component